MSHSTQKSPYQIYLLNIIAMMGFAVACYLTQHFYSVRSGTAGFKSLCNVGAAMNCDVVSASPQAEFLFGLPLSSFVAGWFVALFLISLMAHRLNWRRESLRAAFWLSVFGVIMAVPYIIVMAFRLKTYCLFCLVIDGLNLSALFLVLSLRAQVPIFSRPLDGSKWKWIVPLVGTSVVLTVFCLRSLDQFAQLNFDPSTLSAGVLKQPPVPTHNDADLPTLGPANAPITIVEFSDFQCPYCRLAALSVHSVLNRYPGKIRVIFRNYPLNSECNPDVPQTMHPGACVAARAAYCANLQGKFEEVYQLLFENQNLLSQPQILTLTRSTGIQEAQLKACMESPESTAAIARDIQEAHFLNISSTPTFFINGRKMEGAYPVPSWNLIIDELLREHP